MTDTNILLDLETVRIKRFDRQNVVIEKLVEKKAGTFRNPGTGELIEKPDREEWEERGYYSDVQAALRSIYRSDMLIDEERRTLKEYIDIQKAILKKLTDWGL